jgi:phage terminase large subunit-like protein
MRLSSQEYCDSCWSKVQEYVEGVNSGKFVVGKKIKQVVSLYQKMLSEKDKYIYRVKKVDKFFKFTSLVNIVHKNKYVQFPLLPWECCFLAFIFGFYYKDDINKRVITEALLFVGRKNGKTPIAALIQLYGMVCEGVINPQSFLLANTSDQASVALNYARDMIAHTPELNEILIGLRSRILFREENKQGFCKIFSTINAARLEAFSPSMAILDEVHEWNDNSVYQAVKTGTISRENPLTLIITTAGYKNNKFCKEYLDYHKSILDGDIEDENSIGFIYQPDPEDDLKDPACWVKSNPSLEHIQSLKTLKVLFNQSKFSIEKRYFFLTKILNIFCDSPDTWIDEEYLIPVFEEDFDETKLLGKDAFLGIDLSKTTDLSSIVLYVNDGDMSYAIPYFWMANMDRNIIRKSGKDLSNWIFDGYITKCETMTIDMNLIYEKIIELSKKFNLISVQYDPYNSIELIARLKDYGINCELFKQSPLAFNYPLKAVEDMIYNKRIKLKNPCLFWNFSNVVIYFETGNGNIKIVKSAQKDSVDGCVALAMSIGGWVKYTFGEEIMGINQYLEASKSKT